MAVLSLADISHSCPTAPYRSPSQVVLVKERYIALAMLRLVEMEKAVVEGGGAVGLAAMLQGALPELAGRRVVLPLCGGNVDTPVLGRVLERGMAADGRLVKFEAVVSDRPGGIAGLTKARATMRGGGGDNKGRQMG